MKIEKINNEVYFSKDLKPELKSELFQKNRISKTKGKLNMQTYFHVLLGHFKNLK